MSNVTTDSLFSAETTGPKLPFLSYGENGCQYGLELKNVFQWNDKVSGEWRCRFDFLVVEAEGAGATPVGTQACALMKEDRRYKFHEKDFQNIGKAVIGADGWTKEHVAELFKSENQVYKSKFKDRLFMAQVTKNDKKRDKEGKPYAVFAYMPAPTETPEK